MFWWTTIGIQITGAMGGGEMKKEEQLEYERLKGNAINGTMNFDKAMRYFALTRKYKEGKANDKTRNTK